MNKLVRDNIPNIIEQKGDNRILVILDSYDYYNELKKKLSEELLNLMNPMISWNYATLLR